MWFIFSQRGSFCSTNVDNMYGYMICIIVPSEGDIIHKSIPAKQFCYVILCGFVLYVIYHNGFGYFKIPVY